MKTENGQVKLERGEKAFKAVYLGSEIMQGVRKSDNKPYSFCKQNFKLFLQTRDGAEYKKMCEAIFEADYRPNVEEYKECYVVYSMGNDPTKAPHVVGFIPIKEATTPTTPVSEKTDNTSTPTEELTPVEDNDMPF